MQWSDFRKSHKIRDLLLLLLSRTGGLAKSPNFPACLAWRVKRWVIIWLFCKALFHPPCAAVHTNREVEIRKTPKLYIYDPGLARQFAQVDEGALFENAVYVNLHPEGRVWYYQRKNGVRLISFSPIRAMKSNYIRIGMMFAKPLR